MQKIIIALCLFGLFCSPHAFAQQTEDAPGPQGRTYPIDSCLYFQIPVNFLVGVTKTLGNGNQGIKVNFQSTDPTFSNLIGKGKFIIDPSKFPVDGYDWSDDAAGAMVLVVPDNALAFASGDPDAGIDFPIVINGFIQAVGQSDVAPPENWPWPEVLDPAFPIFFQLTDLLEVD